MSNNKRKNKNKTLPQNIDELSLISTSRGALIFVG